jgi:hypothetical protein
MLKPDTDPGSSKSSLLSPHSFQDTISAERPWQSPFPRLTFRDGAREEEEEEEVEVVVMDSHNKTLLGQNPRNLSNNVNSNSPSRSSLGEMLATLYLNQFTNRK